MFNVLELKVHWISKFNSACRCTSRIEQQWFAIRRNRSGCRTGRDAEKSQCAL